MSTQKLEVAYFPISPIVSKHNGNEHEGFLNAKML